MPAIIDKARYTTIVTTTGGRAGRATSDDGLLDLALARPGSGRATNPEQLLAAGWSACFQSALQHVATARGVDAAASTVRAKVTLGTEADGGFALQATLSVSIPGQTLEAVQALADEAHGVCPYSKATRGNIEVDVRAEAA